MEDIKIGAFIRDMRLDNGMTQQQLADKLGVTDKAVSKWERSVSYPDITILRELADALDVSVAELLAGKRDPQPSPVPPEVQDVVLDTVSYAETARKRNSGWKFWVFVGLTSCCLIAVLVLLIVGWACGSLWASWIAIRAIALGWAVCYPLLRTVDHPIRNAMVIASIAVFPFLWTLGIHPLAWQTGVVVISVAYVWSVYWIFMRHRHQRKLAVALVVLLGGLLDVSINIMAYRLLDAAIIVTLGTLFLDLLCLVGAHFYTERIRQ